jgi:hypothetical protein
VSTDIQILFFPEEYSPRSPRADSLELPFHLRMPERSELGYCVTSYIKEDKAAYEGVRVSEPERYSSSNCSNSHCSMRMILVSPRKSISCLTSHSSATDLAYEDPNEASYGMSGLVSPRISVSCLSATSLR